jgi:hypothetical protein
MYDRNLSKYDESGVLKNLPEEDIIKGDWVSYTDTISVGKKHIKVNLAGMWDGEKVEFSDKHHTIVRNKRWLKKL